MKVDYRILATYEISIRYIFYSPQVRSWKTLWIWMPLAYAQASEESAQEYIDLHKGTFKIPAQEIVHQETVIK